MKIIEYGGWGKKMEIPSRTMGIWSCWTASPTVHSDAVLITVVGVSWAFLMVITLVSSKFSQALQKKNVHLPLSEKVEGYGRPYQRQLSLSATQRKNKGSCVFQHRDYNTILEFWQQQTEFCRNLERVRQYWLASWAANLHPVWWKMWSVCSTPQQRQGWGREPRKE